MTPGDYMLYCDVVYGTEKFRGVTFTTYRPSTTGYKTTSHTDYSYQYENGYICGNVYWFKYEPLQWRVINSQTGLVISEIIIDSVPYSDYVKKGSDGEYKIKADLVRASDNKVIKSSQEEIVNVKTGFFAKIIAFFREIFSALPVYEDNIKK